MTLKMGIAMVAAFALVASSASAAGMKKGQMVGTLAGGLQVPTGDFGDVAKTGFGGAASVDYAVSPAVTLGGTIQYNRNGISDDLKTALDLLIFPFTADGHYTVMHYGADMKFFFNPESTTRPYFIAGGGIYSYKATIEAAGLVASDSNSDAGINGGFGVMFDAGSKTHIGLQGLYHDIFTEGNSTQYFNVQAVFSFDLNTP